jgi:plasmid stabilization system protein ParE
MPLQIRYSQRARSEYKELLTYVILNFGIQKATEIDAVFEKLIHQISENPKMYSLFDEHKNIRKCVISKQTSLYYRISGKYIELVSFRGNLMNPVKTNLE